MDDYRFEVLIDARFVEKPRRANSAATQLDVRLLDSSKDEATEDITEKNDLVRIGEELARKRREMPQQKIPPHEAILPFLGTWKVSPGNVTILFSSSGDNRVTASLVRSSAILSASGDFYLDGKDLVADRYQYN